MISIIVLTRNRPELTHQTLGSLTTSLKDSAIRHEIIIVDNHSGLPTRRVIDRFHSQANIIRLPTNVGVGAGKNIGVGLSRGDLLYISDNDIYFFAGWLEQLLLTHQHFPECKIIGGFRHPYHGLQKLLDRQGIKLERSDQQVGSSWFLTKDTWDTFGPLQEGLEVGKDDVAMCDRVTAASFFVGSVCPHVVFHCGAHNTSGHWSPGGQDWSQNTTHTKVLPKHVIIK